MPDSTLSAMEEVRERLARSSTPPMYGRNLLRLIAQPDFEEKIAGIVAETYAAEYVPGSTIEREIARAVADFLARSAVGGSDV